MKPEHFRSSEPRKCCTTCKFKKDSSATNNKVFLPFAGFGELHCDLHHFEIQPFKYMPEYEASELVCDDYEVLPGYGKPINETTNS